MFRRSAAIGLLVLSGALPSAAGEPTPYAKIAPWLEERLGREGQVEFLVLLDSPGRPPLGGTLTAAELYARLTASAQVGHRGVLAELKARGVAARSFYLVDAILVRGDAALARALAARQEVARIVGNPRVRGLVGGPVDPWTVAPEVDQWNVTMVRAPDVWSTYLARGEGVVVASADTGVDWTHPAYTSRYRGLDPGTGSVDHAYAWHDAFGTYADPYDDYPHGTHTLGTMVGGGGIGVAPGATWIACRNMSLGFGTPASYIDCMEWTLAPYPPGGDPLTDGRPDLAAHIVNNSWTCIPSEGCDALTLEEPLARVRQAGILMVAAAGNGGSACSTIDFPPALSASALTVGAVASSRQVTSFSSRGPVSIDGSGRRKPDLVAPGSTVYSTLPNGGYGTSSGTSMAAPHVAGAAALLWSQRPALRGLVLVTECILERSASTSATVPGAQVCGGIPPTTFPNNVLGYGLLDAYAAIALPGSDADPAPDVCDCASVDPSAYGAPTEVAHLLWTGRDTLVWDAQDADTGSGILYDVLRGDLGQLQADHGIGGAACFAQDLPASQATDALAPDLGAGLYYLVRARNVCGNPGWGPSRTNPACE